MRALILFWFVSGELIESEEESIRDLWEDFLNDSERNNFAVQLAGGSSLKI